MQRKKFGNTISKTLNSLDKFDTPVQLNLKGGLSSTSALGGLVSLGIILFLAYQALVQTIGMFNQDSPQVIQTNQFQTEPDEIPLSRDNNFFMSILSRVGNDFVNISDHSLISFKGLYVKIHINETGIPVRLHYAQILWAPCNKSNFPQSTYSQDIFDKYHFNLAYCARGLNFTDPDTGVCPENIQKDHPACLTPPDFIIRGNAFAPIYEFMDLMVTICNPADAISISGLKCSPTALNETLAAGGVSVFLAFGNNYIDPNNYDTPNNTFLDFIDWSLHPQQTRTANVYIDKETIEDYDSYIFTDKSRKRTFYSISADKMREQQLTPRNYLLDATIRRSNLNRHTIRTYPKIFDVFSSVGGLSGTLFLLGSVLALGYSQYKYFMVLSNELYDFEKPQESISVKKLVMDTIQDITIDKNNQSSSVQVSQILPAPRKPAKIDIKEYFESLKTKKKLEYNEFTYIKGFFLKLLRKQHPNEQLAQKAKKKVAKDLDLSRIIKKIKEIDKLKMLLMSPSQIEAFNLIKNPVITQDNKSLRYSGSVTPPLSVETPTLKSQVSNLPVLEVRGKPSKYEKLYSAYKQIKEDRIIENARINEKLLGMIDEEVINVFNQVEIQNRRSFDRSRFDQITITQEIQDKSMNINTVLD